MISFIGAVIIGGLAGLVAKMLTPGRDPGGFIVTVLLGIAGYLTAMLGAGSGSPPLLLASSLLLGSGGGLALAAGLSLTARLARPGRRGALSAVFLGCAYVGFGAPYVVAVAAQASSVEVPLAVGAGLAALLAVRLLVATRRGQTSD